MAFKLRLQIFFVILTVVPLLVGGWMIQRTVIESRRTSVDQRWPTGVGTLGAQYAAVLESGRRALETRADQRPIADGDRQRDTATVRRIADRRSGGGLRITVQDASGKCLDAQADWSCARIDRRAAIGTTDTLATVDGLCGRQRPDHAAQQADDGHDARPARPGNHCSWRDETGHARRARWRSAARSGSTSQDARYRAAARGIGRPTPQVVALYPQQKLDSYASSIRAARRALHGPAAGPDRRRAPRSRCARSRTRCAAFADGIRAVAAGRFDQRLPVRGNDEFSQFGAVFNEMSSQLEQRIEELDSERRRVQEFGQRFGAALAATHDVAGLLEIVVDSAVQLARAEGARLLVADEGTDVLVEQLRRGDLGAAAGPARRARALRRGHRGPRTADAAGRDRRRAGAAAGGAARGRGARARAAHAGRRARSGRSGATTPSASARSSGRAPSRSRTPACTG